MSCGTVSQAWWYTYAMHPRKAIRAAAKAALIAVGPPVYTNRAEPLINTSWQSDLPALVIYTLDETAQPAWDAMNRTYKRTTQLVVEINVAADDNTDDALDDWAELVENAVTQDDSLGGTCSELVLVSSRCGIKSEGEQLMGVCVILFDATYYDSLPRTSTLPDLSGITAKVLPHD